MHLIDTNVLILAIAGKEPEASFLKKTIKQSQAVLSVIVIAEFLSRPSAKERQAFNRLVNRLPIADIKLSTAYLAARFRRESKKISRLALIDCLLAAQAYESNLSLVTNNAADFPFKDLRVIAPHI